MDLTKLTSYMHGACDGKTCFFSSRFSYSEVYYNTIIHPIVDYLEIWHWLNLEHPNLSI